MKLRWLNNALRSLRAAHAYIALDNPSSATRTAKRIEQAVELLATHPLLGHEGIVPGTRELVIPGLPYLVVYRVTDKEVQILRVFHAKQDTRMGYGSALPTTSE